MWWLSLVLAVAPSPARFVMEVGGVPVGALEVRREDGAFVYQSTQLFRRGPVKAAVRLPVDARGRTAGGRVPEVLALWERPRPGCLDTVEERTLRPTRTCVAEVDGGVTGTVDAARFTARYGADGQLSELTLPGARFVRSDAPLGPAADVFAEGFEVTGQGRGIALAPAQQGVREVAVRAAGTRAEVESQASCLELARRGGGAVVLGLVVEEGRAYPHAWVLRGGEHLDPSALPGTRRRYLRFPDAEAGRLYLELLSRGRKVVREGP